MNRGIFRKAKYFIDNDKVERIYEDHLRTRIKVGNMEVRLENHKGGLKCACPCRQASIKAFNPCPHMLAAIIYYTTL